MALPKKTQTSARRDTLLLLLLLLLTPYSHIASASS
jgi:hypothetical protein